MTDNIRWGRRNRDALAATLIGFKGRCPNCRRGKIFGKFLKVKHECASCGQELHHHRADDFPPYLVIFIVGHIVVTGVMLVEARTDWSIWTHMAIWSPIAIAMSLALLQPIKGAVIGLQWALRMHGFGSVEDIA